MACTHVAELEDHNGIVGADASGDGCVDCLAMGGRWLHLRRCLACGHTGCCDSSPNKHASAHFAATSHPLIQSYEPGEEWTWCFVDQDAVELDLPPSPAHS